MVVLVRHTYNVWPQDGVKACNSYLSFVRRLIEFEQLSQLASCVGRSRRLAVGIVRTWRGFEAAHSKYRLEK